MTALLCWGSSEFQEETNAKGAWQGVRAKSSLYNIFTRENEMDKDSRRQMLRTDATTNFEITNEANFVNNGIPVTKFYNVYKDGSKPASSEAWTDFPLFRLGEIYLNLAEAVLRGGQGATKAEALGYLNDLRKRAYTDKLCVSASTRVMNTSGRGRVAWQEERLSAISMPSIPFPPTILALMRI